VQTHATSLRFANCAEEAANFSLSAFDDARMRRFLAIDSDAKFPFSPAVSPGVDCRDRAEIGRLWNALAADPGGGQCGWIEDRFGLSRQILAPELKRHGLRSRSGRVTGRDARQAAEEATGPGRAEARLPRRSTHAVHEALPVRHAIASPSHPRGDRP